MTQHVPYISEDPINSCKGSDTGSISAIPSLPSDHTCQKSQAKFNAVLDGKKSMILPVTFPPFFHITESDDDYNYIDSNPSLNTALTLCHDDNRKPKIECIDMEIRYGNNETIILDSINTTYKSRSQSPSLSSSITNCNCNKNLKKNSKKENEYVESDSNNINHNIDVGETINIQQDNDGIHIQLQSQEQKCAIKKQDGQMKCNSNCNVEKFNCRSLTMGIKKTFEKVTQNISYVGISGNNININSNDNNNNKNIMINCNNNCACNKDINDHGDDASKKVVKSQQEQPIINHGEFEDDHKNEDNHSYNNCKVRYI